MKRLLHMNNRFWTHDHSLTSLLIYLIVTLFIGMPMATYRWGFVVNDILFNLILLSGVFAVLGRWRQQLRFITMAISASAFRMLTYFFDDIWILEVSYVIAILFLLILSRMVVRHIFKDGPVNFYRIQGSIVVFIIIGMIWAYAYNLQNLFSPGSFSFLGKPMPIDQPFTQYLYYSFVTMSTLGDPEILPIHPITKSLVMFQGMIGLLYPVVMIARLVSMEVDHSSRGVRHDQN